MTDTKKPKTMTPADAEDKAVAKVHRELAKLNLSDSAKSRVIDALARRYTERKGEVQQATA